MCLAASAPAFAQSPFDGTWKGQVDSMKVTAKPDAFTLKDGTFACSSCLPPFSVKADGKFHAVADKPYWDETAVTVVDARTVSYQYRKNGKVIANSTDKVSADGATLTNVSSNTNNAAGVPIESTSTQRRVGAAPTGAHVISGSWEAEPATSVSDAGLTVSLKVDGDMLHLTSPLGETLDAKFGGPFAPNVGDPGGTMTKVERLGPRSLRLTDMRQNKVTGVGTYSIEPDGRTMKIVFRDPRNGATSNVTALKQP